MDAVSRLLLRRGARTDLTPTADSPSIADAAREAGNHRIADLLHAPLGGRHCRIHSLNGRPELNGSTGVAVAYSAARERYTIEVDGVEERVRVRPANLCLSTDEPPAPVPAAVSAEPQPVQQPAPAPSPAGRLQLDLARPSPRRHRPRGCSSWATF